MLCKVVCARLWQEYLHIGWSLGTAGLWFHQLLLVLSDHTHYHTLQDMEGPKLEDEQLPQETATRLRCHLYLQMHNILPQGNAASPVPSLEACRMQPFYRRAAFLRLAQHWLALALSPNCRCCASERT